MRSIASQGSGTRPSALLRVARNSKHEESLPKRKTLAHHINAEEKAQRLNTSQNNALSTQ